jgi:hypothetical protein
MTLTSDPLISLQAARSALEHSIDTWDTVLQVATAVVVVGVVVELIATVIEVIDRLRKHERPGLHHIFTFIGSAILILSLVAEFEAEHNGAALQTALRSNNESVQALLSQRANAATADAVSIAKQFGGLHSYVNSEAAEITGAIADLKNDRARLTAARNETARSAARVEKALTAVKASGAALSAELSTINSLRSTVQDLTTPRTINIPRMAAKLVSFGKVPFVMALSSDNDASNLAQQISYSLTLAGWDWKANRRADNTLEFGSNFSGKPFMRNKVAQGVLVEIALKDRGALQAPTVAVVAALMAENIKNVHGILLTDAQMKDQSNIYGVIHIIVGTRY